jgi:hypothetical protein
MADWQPISSAPKDGAEILGFRNRYESLGRREVFITKWFEPWNCWTHGSMEWHPTHWMPLPDPPAVTLAQRGDDDK